MIDCIFGIDLALNFFFAYYDQEDNVVDKRKKIAMDYLYGWFFIDLLTVLPIS
jgi:hyperpolarization activated cyclic nucleotide-gated potassium channel 1